MKPRPCTYGAFTGELRLEGQSLVFEAHGGQRETLGEVRDGFTPSPSPTPPTPSCADWGSSPTTLATGRADSRVVGVGW